MAINSGNDLITRVEICNLLSSNPRDYEIRLWNFCDELAKMLNRLEV